MGNWECLTYRCFSTDDVVSVCWVILVYFCLIYPDWRWRFTAARSWPALHPSGVRFSAAWGHRERTSSRATSRVRCGADGPAGAPAVWARVFICTQWGTDYQWRSRRRFSSRDLQRRGSNGTGCVWEGAASVVGWDEQAAGADEEIRWVQTATEIKDRLVTESSKLVQLLVYQWFE